MLEPAALPLRTWKKCFLPLAPTRKGSGNAPFGAVAPRKQERGKCIRHRQLLMIPHDFGFPLQEEKIPKKRKKKRLRFSAPADRALTSEFTPQYVSNRYPVRRELTIIPSCIRAEIRWKTPVGPQLQLGCVYWCSRTRTRICRLCVEIAARPDRSTNV